MEYKILSDYHHSALLNSTIMLFEERLGGAVYRPIGMDWVNEGYWAVYNHPATQEQYLTTAQGYKPEDGTAPLNDIEKFEEGVYYCHDISSGKYNKAITLEQFKKMDIDILIASLPQHIKLYQKLIKDHKPNAKLIYQIGNQWNVQEVDNVKNVLASAMISFPAGINGVTYHQEFPLDVFAPAEPVNSKLIGSFVNCFNVDKLFEKDWQLFQNMEHNMPDWKFRAWGGECRDGCAHGETQVAEFMRNCRFVWHTKSGGDGYGHIIHNTGAVARPMVVKTAYYKNKLGGLLMKDGETCIAIDGLDVPEIINKIEYYDDNKRYQTMSNNIKENFKEVVDFDKEAEDIKVFLQNLQ
jgi:hypothetical protein